MLPLNFVHLIIVRTSSYPRVPLIRNSIFAQNDPFSHLWSHIIMICQYSVTCRYSRRMVWIRVGVTNNDPMVIAGYFMDAIREIGSIIIYFTYIYIIVMCHNL